jgi:phosphoenolpyruvate---glycerone phosphotransferase subunit DhaM
MGQISLIIVSHSRQIAEGVRELAAQMTQDPIPLAAVGGIADGQGGYALGTDAHALADALRCNWQPDGVLLLADVGSAVISAETAIALLPPDMQHACLISNAPLVEGAVIAALEASLGRSLSEVNAAAEAASHLVKCPRPESYAT